MTILDQFSKSFLTAEVFAARALKAVDGLTGSDVRLRRDRGTKELLEEVLPLATFLLSVRVPDRKVRGRYCATTESFDARLRLSGPEVDGGFLEPHYHLEVTTAVSADDYLRREHLERHGYVFGGPIHREGSRRLGDDRIVSKAGVRDGDAFIRETCDWARECLEKKARIAYPEPCMLLLNLQPAKHPSVVDWASIASDLSGVAAESQFSAVFAVHPWTNMVFPISVKN